VSKVIMPITHPTWIARRADKSRIVR